MCHLKTMASVGRGFLILLWTVTLVQPDVLQAKGVQVFPPVNFTLTVSALAQVLLQWKPNPRQEQSNYTVRYDVKILSPVPEEYDTKKTHSIRTAVLHNGFSAHIRTLLLHNDIEMGSDWVKEKIPPPPGAPETSVTNLSCVTRITISSTVSLHCTWLPGQGAPEDTKYFLFYRYEKYTEECQDYVKDKWHRNTECRFAVTYIDPEEVDNLVVIYINGSSKHAAIKPFQQLFNQNAIEKVNVPRNVTVFLEQNDLLATWEKPISSFRKECFTYELYLFNLKSGTKQILKISSNDFRVRIDGTSQYAVQIRANHHICCARGVWSDWTEIIYVGQNKLENTIPWILAVLCVLTCCTLLLVAVICKMLNASVEIPKPLLLTSLVLLRIGLSVGPPLHQHHLHQLSPLSLGQQTPTPVSCKRDQDDAEGTTATTLRQRLTAKTLAPEGQAEPPKHRNHVWSKLFPPIPTPSNKFRDPFPNDYERARTCTSETETEFGSFTEDFYCSTLDDPVF